VTDRLDDLRTRLESIAEELADLALDCLHEALHDSDQRDHLAAEERRLTRARRAVEKAAALLADPERDRTDVD
jgi:hypothetical protein